MEGKRPRQSRWLVTVAFVTSILIVLIALGTLMWERTIYSVFGNSLGSTVERAVINAGLFLALPLGLLDLAGSVLALVRSKLGRWLAVMYAAVGLIGIVTGVFWWRAISRS